MTLEQYLLICLMEEAAEVAHRASKCLRFGTDGICPGETQTHQRLLANEVRDMGLVLQELERNGMPLDLPALDADVMAKHHRFKKSLECAREKGILEE